MRHVTLTRLRSLDKTLEEWAKSRGHHRSDGVPVVGMPYTFYTETGALATTSWITRMRIIKYGQFYGFDTIDGQYLLSIQ